MRLFKNLMAAASISIASLLLLAGCAVKEVKPKEQAALTYENYQEQIKNGKVMVFFYLPNDVNSIDMFASMKAIDFDKEEITLYPVDINKEMPLYRSFNLGYVPTVFYIKDGKTLKQETGAKTPQELKEIIHNVYKGSK